MQKPQGRNPSTPTHFPTTRKTPRVVNKRDSEPYDVYIGRPSKWGNPFVIGKDGDRSTVILKYAEWLDQRPELKAQARSELRGKVLCCFCAPKACHGDILLAVANDLEK